MPVYPTIDPGVISGLLDPYLKGREQQQLGQATADAMTALEKQDYPGMARALQYVAGVSPHTAATLMAQRHALESERLAQQRFLQTPHVIEDTGFGKRYGLPPSTPGGPWRPITLPPGTPAAAVPSTRPTEEWSPIGKSEEEIKQEVLRRMPDEQRAQAASMWPDIVGVEEYRMHPNQTFSKFRGLSVIGKNAANILAEVRGNEPYNESEFPQRSAAYSKYTNQYIPQQLAPIVKAFEHANTARQAIAELKNGNYQMANTLLNRMRAATGQGAYAGAALTTQILGAEAAKAMAGSMSGEAERLLYGKLLDPNASPETTDATLGALEQMMGEQMVVFGHNYGEATRRKDFTRHLMPRSKAFYELLQKQHNEQVIDPTKMGFGRTKKTEEPQQQQPQQKPQQLTREQLDRKTKELIAAHPEARAEIIRRYRETLKNPNAELPE